MGKVNMAIVKTKSIAIKQLLLSILFLTILYSCGKISPKGEIESKDIKVEDFNQLKLEGDFFVFFVKSPQNLVSIESYSNIIDNLKIKVSDKTLNISEKKEVENVDFYSITIYSDKMPEKILLSKNVEMNISGEINPNNIQLDLKNNTKFIGAIQTKKMNIVMNENSRANFIGTSAEINIKISDSASVVAPYLVSNVLNINAQNGAFAEFAVKDTIKGEMKNTSKLWYYETPILKLKKEEKVEVKKEEK